MGTESKMKGIWFYNHTFTTEMYNINRYQKHTICIHRKKAALLKNSSQAFLGAWKF